ncbi:MAG: indole-3-glycerol phosphate synthase TrpC [Xanthomonadales bacterium]
MSDILKKIIATKAAEVAVGMASTGMAEIAVRAADMPPARAFAQRIRSVMSAGPAVIAEIKKASPSAGIIRENFQPDRIAVSYASGGAACLSVLTDVEYFKGANEYLQQARSACSLPALRKDFLVDPWQVYESRVLGADCILLIVAALERAQLLDLDGLAREIGLDVLVEVHHEAELDDALATGASLIGVNNRDLHTFTTDLAVSERLRPMIPQDRTMVTESGIHTAQDVARMGQCGIHAFLVGEAFMRREDPGGALRALFFGDIT